MTFWKVVGACLVAHLLALVVPLILYGIFIAVVATRHI